MARELGPGEAAELASRKRWLAYLVAAFVLGGVTGGLVQVTTDVEAGSTAGPLPVWMAGIFSVIWLAVMGYGAWYYETKADELERHANYYGYAVGGGLILLLYPVWYMFWWAGIVPEPSHEVLMGIMLVAALAGYLWKKYR